jgi:hypothetical protein
MSRVRIPVEHLPPPNLNGDHVIRFRIITEDRNKTSDWSQLYVLKSIGQYKPTESEVRVNYIADLGTYSVTWDTPTIYNYDGVSDAVEVQEDGSVVINSASIVIHNHSQNFKQHSTDIFVKWSNSYGGNFKYHDRVLTDSTTIIKDMTKIGGHNPTNVTIIGLVSTHGIETTASGSALDAILEDAKERFLIFEYSGSL